jgi:hypothetical protein
MVCQEDVGDPFDPELREVVEDLAVAEVDEDRVGSRAEDVDVAGVVVRSRTATGRV